ncbi:MAG: hypothetical protein WAM71_08330 [Candidatus Korobacteraceae bacterium]
MMSASQNSSSKLGPVVVSAGRRVDAPDTSTPRFPPQSVPVVRVRVEEYLQQHKPSAVVCSAACGADLILLQAARQNDVPRYVLLPSSPEKFRETSVADRPGDWGAIYDEILRQSNVEVHEVPDGQEGYLEVNRRLLDKAQALAAELGASVAALVIWNQQSRGDDDVTAHFKDEAEQRGFTVAEIPTF